MKSLLVRFSAAALTLSALYGCGGSDGANGINGINGVNGINGTNGTNAVAVTNVATLTPDQWANAKFSGAITGVTISSPPVVTFKVTDAAGNGVIGLGSTSKASTATVASYPNVAFTIAKLVPGSNGSPSKWVSYNVTTVPSTTAASLPGKPNTDNTGTLVDNGDGTYKYTFWRDITKMKDTVAGMATAAKTANANNDVADLGDLTYDANLTHRVVLIVSGNARGTGTNTAGAVQVTAGVAMKNPVNAVYDFIPATGKTVSATDTQREIVKVTACFECHSKFSFHGGARQDTRLCVTCHTDQRKYGNAEATKTATGFSGSTEKIDGRAVKDLPNFIHKIHMGEDLTKDGYNSSNVLFNEVRFPQEKNCTKCHNGAAGAKNQTAQGDNWKNVPSRLACGACHDGIDFATGKGTAIGKNGKAVGGHVGGAQTTDANCKLCHEPASIAVYHTTNVLTLNNPTTPAGMVNFGYSIKSVTVNPSRQAVVTFQITMDGKPVTAFNTPATVVNSAGATVVDPKFQPITGFVGGPSIYVAYAVPQDGISTPADYNVSSNVTLTNLLVSGSLNQGSLTGPDAGGYWTATLKGTTAAPVALPANASLVTGAVIGSFTQINLAGYPYTFANVTATPTTAASGGLVRPTMLAKMTATGYTARRAIVETARCNNCHDQLGTNPNFHGGARNDPTACNICHNGNRTSSGWTADSSTYIHAIHGSGKRSVNYTWAAASATDGFYKIQYPGVLRNCEQCHLPDTYNFGATASAAALPNLLWSTTATGKFDPASATAYRNSPYIVADNKTDYGVNFSFAPATGVTTPAAGTTLVNSPISSACYSCHDTAAAKAHIQANGGAIYEPRSTAMQKTETCLVCHGAGKVVDVKTMHLNF